MLTMGEILKTMNTNQEHQHVLTYYTVVTTLLLQLEQKFLTANALVNIDFLILLTRLCSYPQLCK